MCEVEGCVRLCWCSCSFLRRCVRFVSFLLCVCESVWFALFVVVFVVVVRVVCVV